MFPKPPPLGNPEDDGEDSDQKHTNDSKSSSRSLPPLVEPRAFDVLLGRGKSNLTHPGNQRFQVLVEMNHENYLAASSRQEKVHITQQVVVAVREGGGWFLRYDDARKGWVQISEQAARKKVAQAIQYRRRRVAEQDSTLDPQQPRQASMHTTNAIDATRLSRSRFSGSEIKHYCISQETRQSILACDPEFATTLSFQQQYLANQQMHHLALDSTARKEKQEAKRSLSDVQEDAKKSPAGAKKIDTQQHRRQTQSSNQEHLLSDDEILSALGFSTQQKDTESPEKLDKKDPQH